MPEKTYSTASTVSSLSNPSEALTDGWYRVPPPEDHPIFARIGQVASAWGLLEHILDSIIWNLVDGPSSETACITAQIMGAPPRCRAIATLATAKGINGKSIRKIITLMQKSYNVGEKRHRIVHDPWFSGDTTNRPAQFKSMPYSDLKHGLEYGIQTADDEKITQTLDEIFQLVQTAKAIADEISEELLSGRHGEK